MLNIEDLRDYCIGKSGTSESFPFDESTLVFKVMDKMFALVNLDGELRINLKCKPENAIFLREKYSFVIPGYHMNKRHWNTVIIENNVPGQLVFEWIDDSYALVTKTLTKEKQNKLKKLNQ